MVAWLRLHPSNDEPSGHGVFVGSTIFGLQLR
jgi:hypothetical protein